MNTVTLIDETTSGNRSDAWYLEIFEETLPLREIIRRRIFQEVAEHNARDTGKFQGLVIPNATETALNGEPAKKAVDPQKQYEAAEKAFSRNGFVVLVDDRQVTELDHEVSLKQGTEITFLKLVPLVGG